jgi:hypothetical protein
MITRTRIVVLVATLAAIATFTAIAVSRDEAREGRPARSRAATTTTTTSTTPAPAPGTSSTTAPPNATPVDGGGAVLAAPPAPVPKSSQPPQADCRALGDAGWTVHGCGQVAMAGGERVWLTERTAVPGSATEAWRAYVLHWSANDRAWIVDLRFEDDVAAQVFDVNVLASDLTGDGKAELVFGFRYTGTGSVLGYDVVGDGPDGRVAIRVHRELSHGAALVTGGRIVDYGAQYPNGEPNCCPAYTQRSIVSASGDAWYVTPDARVDGAGPANL